MSTIKKVISVVLTVLMLVGVFSVATPVFAADLQNNEKTIEALQSIKSEIQENYDSEMLTEIVEKRDRYTKVFRNNSGTQTAVVSATPIHYKTENGWKDIDNTLNLETKETRKFYNNKNNSFKTSIPESLSSGDEIIIEKDDYKISFELSGTDVFKAKNNVKGIHKAQKKQKDKLENGVDADFLNKTKALTFKNVGENTDIEYAVTSTGLKENIIIKEKPASEVSYKYEIKVENLVAQFNNDNSVIFKNVKGEEIFKIPAPVMFDAENKTSTDIQVDFAGENGKYLLSYKPSYKWLCEDVKYPVTVDPVIDTVDEDIEIKDTYVDSSAPTENNGSDTVFSTCKTAEDEQISYLSLSGNYIIKSGSKIKSVLMSVYYSAKVFVDESVEIGAYPITNSWDENSVTYETKPTIGSIADKKTFTDSTSYGYQTFDVTKAYVCGAAVEGIALKQTDDSEGLAVLLFNSSEHENSGYHPYFVIEYYESQGIEEQFDYHAYDAGRAGMVYFNDFTNQVYIEREELGLSGIHMPVQIKRYYNSGIGGTYAMVPFVMNNIFSFYGYGWQTNYNQSIEYHKEIDGTEHILYCNGEGQTTYFERSDTITEGKRKWVEKPDRFSNSKGYTLWLSTEYDSAVSSSLQYATVEDSGGMVYEFNSSGLLVKINSADENSTDYITISYTDNTLAIDKIIDGAGREYRFSYTEYEDLAAPVLTSIQAYTSSGSPITVKHNGSNVDYKVTYDYNLRLHNGSYYPDLVGVTYPDGEKVNYSYSATETTIQNINGYTVRFYNYNNGVGISELVYTDGAETPVNGGELKIVTANNNPYERAYLDPNNVIQTKQFDLYGRVINVKNNDGTNAPRIYSANIKANGQIYYGLYIDYEADLEENGTNLLTNGSFENGLSGWDVSSSNYVARVTDYDSNSNSENPNSLRLTGVQSGVNGIVYAQQNITVENGASGDEYRLDYFNKNNANSHNSAETFCLTTVLVEASKTIDGETTTETVFNSDINSFNTNWQRYRHGFTIDMDYDKITVTLAYYFQYGKTWFDDISLVNTFKVSTGSSSDSDDSTESDSESTETTQCTCEGCIQPDCPCRACVNGETCTNSLCKRGYDYGNDSDGAYFTVSDGTTEMGMSQTINGNYYDSQRDLNGIYTGYSYNQKNGQLNSVSDGNDNVTAFTYDAMSRLKSVSKSVEGLSSGNKMETSYSYADDRISSITHNGFSYNYEYDAWGNATAVKVGTQPLVSYSYGDNQYRSRVNRITYGNGDYTDYAYNEDGNIQSLKSYSAENALTADYEYTYGDYGVITKIKNNIENSEVRYTDGKTEIVLLNGEGEADDSVIYSTQLNENGETVENLAGISYTKSRGTAQTDDLSGVTSSEFSIATAEKTFDFDSESDYFGRAKSRGFSFVYDKTEAATKTVSIVDEYSYKGLGENKTSALVSEYSTTISVATQTEATNTTSEMLGMDYQYEYDSNGNITSCYILNEGEIVAGYLYTYDEAGQLVREDNSVTGLSYVYVYDKGGNIAQKIEYQATDGELGEPLTTINYTYDSAWKDKLVGYNGTAISTDSIGNPLNYIGRNYEGGAINGTLEWDGRQLASVTLDGARYEYEYNSDGLRTQMTIYNSNNEAENIFYYIWQGGKLQGYFVSDGSGNALYSIKLLYENGGEAAGYEVLVAEDNSRKTYIFHKNLQGDIAGIFNEQGEVLLTFTYDAWGNISTDFNTGNLENIEEAFILILTIPLTYRGYMYDIFTGLYYLQSRYYNPAYGRFLNADTTDILEVTQGTTHGANLFAYCNNNPIMNVDYGGASVVAFIIAFITLLVVGLVDNIFGVTVFQEAIIKLKFNILLKEYQSLSKLFDAVNIVADILEINGEYWEIYMLFATHAKNIIDYGKGYNTEPYYPKYDVICSDGVSYKARCMEAYEIALDCNLIQKNTTWDSLSPEEQYIFVHEMMFYDNAMYHDLLIFSTGKISMWGTAELASFCFDLSFILL